LHKIIGGAGAFLIALCQIRRVGIESVVGMIVRNQNDFQRVCAFEEIRGRAERHA